MSNPYLPEIFFEKIPKVELHCHLDGSVRKSTLLELSKDENLPIPHELFGQVHASLEKYLEQFSAIGRVLQSRKNIRRIAWELVEDAAFENTFHMEYRFCPTLLTQKGLSLLEATRAALEGGKSAGEKYGISVGVILCGIRSFALEKNLEIVKTAISLKDEGVVGFDLAGPEFGYPAKEQSEAFLLAKEHGLFVTVHAGEGYGADSIEQAIRFGKTDRIGHGTRLIENKKLLSFVAEKSIPLEVCLSSNEQTKAVNSVSEHPLPSYLKAGVAATLCTDNRLVSDTTLTKEYQRAHSELGLDYDQLKKLALDGIESSFLNNEQKRTIQAKMLKQFKDLEETLCLQNHHD